MLGQTFVEDETILWADQQQAGRGQQGAKWKSESGSSLTFSLFRRFTSFPARYPFYLNLAVSLGVKEAMTELGVSQVRIKWPNDILSYSGKLCGILVENQIEKDKLASSVIGLGINVNETRFHDLPNATSMRLATGQVYNREEVLRLVAEKVFKRIRALNSESLDQMKLAYETALFRKDVVSTFGQPDGGFRSGIIRGVNTLGELLVQWDDDSIQAYRPKELQLLY